ncbi:MAG TPA: hypothetical protein VH395_09510, partial [Jatrophihabitantaceae bacterium]
MPAISVRRAAFVVSAAAAVTTVLAACSGSDGGTASSSTGASKAAAARVATVTITSAKGCELDHTSFAAGGITFKIQNKDATAVSEV